MILQLNRILFVLGGGIGILFSVLPRTMAQPTGEGSIRVTPGGFQKELSVGIAELDVTTGRDNELEVQYVKTMAYDLEFSDYFKPLPNSAQMAAQHARDRELQAIDYGAWQSLKAEILVKGRFDDSGNAGTIHLYAHDIYEQASILALRYDLVYDSRERKIREIRRAVHAFADKLVQKYDDMGLPGCAHSYIAFENKQRRADTAGNQKLVREIYIMDYDGRNIRQITQDRNLAISPAWSPDGRKLVYTSFRQGLADLYIYDLDSGQIRVLSAFPGLNSAASWAPDGRSLAVTLSRDGNPEIYVIGANGSNPRRITHTKAVETSPTWSKDGSTIFFISDRYGAPQIMGITADGGRNWRVTRGGHNDDPEVSPRGDKLVYTSNQGGGGFNIWTSNLDGSDARNLTGDLRGNSEHPSWAPDGRHIVFGAPDGRIMVMDADGSDKRALTTSSRIPGTNHSPSWGP